MFEFYAKAEYPLAAAQITLAMLGMGIELTVDDFRRVVVQGRSLVVGFGIQLLLVPALVGLMLFLANPSPGVAVGLALVAAVPGGAASNIFVYLARANVALSISLTAVTTVLALVTTPIVLKLLAGPYLPAAFSMPTGHILREISLFLLLPLCVGLMIRGRVGRSALPWAKHLVRLSLVVLVLIVVGSLGSGRIDPGSRGIFIPALVILLCGAAAQLGLLVGGVARLPMADRFALAIEASARNIGLAILVSASLFPPSSGELGDQAMFVALFYGGTALAVSGSLIFRGRRKIERAPA